MDRVKNLLDTAKKVCSEGNAAFSDAAFARCLHVTPQALNRWRKGLSWPDEVNCARLAELTGEPLARVLGVVGEARAKSSAAKAVWRRLANAACLVLAVGSVAQPVLRIMYSRLKFMLRQPLWTAAGI